MRPSSLPVAPAGWRARPLGPLGLALCGAARVAALLFAGACAPAFEFASFGDPATTVPPPAHAAPAALRGCWVGTYAAPMSARRGRAAVAFTGGSTEHGANASAGWLLLSDAARPAVAGEDACTPRPARDRAGAPTTGAVRVALRAAVAEGGGVAVRSEPYWDTDCGCTVTLTLTARLAGDTLAGAFSARAAATMAAEGRGRWRVVRVAATPVAARTPEPARATRRAA